MCYTSGTTGRPKGVVYSHRSTMLHTLGVGAANPLGIGVFEGDVILPVVPMFHANAWGYPYLATMFGAKIVYPGPHLDPESLLDDFVQEGVTWAAGVPTIWMGILAMLDANPGRWDLSRMKGMLVGGSAVPRAMIAAFNQRHGLKIVHGWGMTETSPVASEAALPGDLADADEETQFDYIALQGLPLPLVELRARDAEGNEIPWDDETMGELEVRGPWVAAGYYDTPEQADRWTDDGWFKTGDIVSIHPRGFIHIQDRSKDVIKSGGEWISSVELENALMGHPAIAEAAVIAVPNEKWDERPLAVCVLREGQTRDRRRAARVPRRRVREVVAAGRVRVRRRDPEDGGRQVPQDGAARDVLARGRPRPSRRRPESRRRSRELGGPERLELVEVPAPEGPSVVQIRAAGVNFMDVLIRRGDYPQPPELPFMPGGEVAGELDGRRVMALPRTRRLRGGGSLRTGSCRCPSRRTFAEGASFLMTFLTAWIPLGAWSSRGDRARPRGRGRGRDRGNAAARHLGARVVATAARRGSGRRLEHGRRRGVTATRSSARSERT